jgi:hypothetical protein
MRPIQLAGRAMRAGGLLLLLTACAGDQEPTAPSMPAAPAEFEGPSFRLTIDVATGDVQVGRAAADPPVPGEVAPALDATPTPN